MGHGGKSHIILFESEYFTEEICIMKCSLNSQPFEEGNLLSVHIPFMYNSDKCFPTTTEPSEQHAK